jgi:gamma-glutamyltranspeptidase/glutathione hydrolase
MAAGHPAAVQAGVAAFESGGSVADAAIAASAALAVVLPQACSFGGDLLALYRDAGSRKIEGLDSAGVAPRRAQPAEFPQGIPLKGVRAAVVPGLAAGLKALHERHGRLAWAGLFSEAIRLAHEGHPLGATVRQFLELGHEELRADAGCRSLFFPSGSMLAAGELLRQPALAETLSAIARDGAEGFYRGDPGRRLVAFSDRMDGLISKADLDTFAPRWVEVQSGSYRGHEVTVMPPSSFGLLLLLQLHALESIAAEKLATDAGHRFESQVRAMQAAFATGEPLIADSDEMRMRARSTAPFEQVRANMRVGGPEHAADRHFGTTCIVAGDAAGNVAVLVQSVFQPFGASCLDPDSGILLNNRMNGFTLDPMHPNCVAPGKKPAHTLCPVIVSAGDRPRWAFASPGGVSQTVTGTQVICNLVDRGMSPAAAIGDPRWCLARSRAIQVEPDFFPSGIAAGKTLPAYVVKDDPYSFGSVKLVSFSDSGQLEACADSRRSASALAI